MSETREMPADGAEGGQIGGSLLGSTWLHSQSTTTAASRQVNSVDAVNQVDRIDFFENGQGVLVIKFKREPGWARPLERRQHADGFDLKAALAWCEGHGFTVRRWPGGARAFRGKPWPIRSRAETLRKRQEMEKYVWEGLRLQPETQLSMQSVLHCDFAFDC